MSDAHTTPNDPRSLLQQRTESGYRLVVHQLHEQLPPPFCAEPEHTTFIIEATIARIASMLPTNCDQDAWVEHRAAGSKQVRITQITQIKGTDYTEKKRIGRFARRLIPSSPRKRGPRAIRCTLATGFPLVRE
jgi:hypothetical protein